MSLQCQAWLVQLSLLSGLSDIALHRHCYESRNIPSLAFWNQAAFLQSKILNQLSCEISDKVPNFSHSWVLPVCLGSKDLVQCQWLAEHSDWGHHVGWGAWLPPSSSSQAIESSCHLEKRQWWLQTVHQHHCQERISGVSHWGIPVVKTAVPLKIMPTPWLLAPLLLTNSFHLCTFLGWLFLPYLLLGDSSIAIHPYPHQYFCLQGSMCKLGCKKKGVLRSRKCMGLWCCKDESLLSVLLLLSVYNNLWRFATERWSLFLPRSRIFTSWLWRWRLSPTSSLTIPCVEYI